MEIVCSAQHHCYWNERKLTGACRMMAAVELHVNATYYAQHLHSNQSMEKVNQ